MSLTLAVVNLLCVASKTQMCDLTPAVEKERASEFRAVQISPIFLPVYQSSFSKMFVHVINSALAYPYSRTYIYIYNYIYIYTHTFEYVRLCVHPSFYSLSNCYFMFQTKGNLVAFQMNGGTELSKTLPLLPLTVTLRWRQGDLKVTSRRIHFIYHASQF